MAEPPTGNRQGRANGPDGLLVTKHLPRLHPGFVPRTEGPARRVYGTDISRLGSSVRRIYDLPVVAGIPG